MPSRDVIASALVSRRTAADADANQGGRGVVKTESRKRRSDFLYRSSTSCIVFECFQVILKCAFQIFISI